VEQKPRSGGHATRTAAVRAPAGVGDLVHQSAGSSRISTRCGSFRWSDGPPNLVYVTRWARPCPSGLALQLGREGPYSASHWRALFGPSTHAPPGPLGRMSPAGSPRQHLWIREQFGRPWDSSPAMVDSHPLISEEPVKRLERIKPAEPAAVAETCLTVAVVVDAVGSSRRDPIRSGRRGPTGTSAVPVPVGFLSPRSWPYRRRVGSDECCRSIRRRHRCQSRRRHRRTPRTGTQLRHRRRPCPRSAC
jgi:hypothetical protein